MKSKLLLTFRPPLDVLDTAQNEFDLKTEGDDLLATSRIIELANQHQAEAILISHGQKLSREEIGQLPSTVKIVATSSVGYDNLDVATSCPYMPQERKKQSERLDRVSFH